MRKKIVSLLLISAMTAAVFAGCSSSESSTTSSSSVEEEASTSSSSDSSDDDSSASTDDSSGGGEATLYAWGDNHWDEYMTVAEEFNELTGDTLTYMQENSLTDLLQTRASQNDMPDMFYAEPYVSLSEWAQGGWLEDLSDEDWVELIPDSILDAVSYDGKVYGFPYSVCYTGFFYNIDIFDELGLSVPTTVSEFQAVCEVLAAEGYIPCAVGIGGSSGWVAYQLFNSLIGAALGDDVVEFAEQMNNGETSFAEVPNLEYVEQMLQMTLIDYNFASPLDNDQSAMLTAFANGEAAMYHNGSWSSSDVLNLNSDINIGFFGYTISEDPEDQVITYDVEIAITITTNAADYDTCAEVLDYFADTETGAKKIGEQSRVPVTDVELDSEVFSETYNDAKDYINAGKTTAWLNWLTPTGFNDDFAGDLQDYAMGTITFDELISIADQKWATYAS